VQRRDHLRYRLWFPVHLESTQAPKVAMNHNIGTGGMLMALASELAVGEPVVVTFRLPPGDVEHSLRGHILRIEANTEDPEGAWPHRVAVAFDEFAPELLPYLETAASRFG
jgi:hypothetical protein